MAFLRLGSTRRVVGLLLGVAALLVVIAVGASAALGGGGQPPPQKTLAQAIHDSMDGPKVQGITARVKLTSSLFGGMTTEQSSALLKGGSGRLWAAPGKLRIELQGDNGDVQIVYADGKGYVYDGATNTAYTFATAATQPANGSASKHDSGGMPTIADIQQRIAKAEQHAAIAGPQSTVVGGQPAYQVKITPKSSGGLIGGAQLAWDAVRGVPLKVAIYARGAGSPALAFEVTDVGYGVDAGAFDVSAPAGAKVVDMGGGSSADTTHTSGSAPAAPSFSAVAPAALGSRDKREVKKLDAGYVVLYGKGLDTIAVYEHQAKPSDKTSAPAPAQDGQQPLELPTVKVNGAKATAFGTPLGGVVSFDRGGISYVVAGSQPLSVLEAAASGL